MRPGGKALAALSAFILAILFSSSGPFTLADLTARDRALRILPERTATRVASILVDEASLRERGPWPWPRPLLAELVARAREAGAVVIALDILLPEAREGDEALAAESATGPTVLAAAPNDAAHISSAAPDRHGGMTLPARSLGASRHLGHVGFLVDADGVVRRIPATVQSGDLSLPALAAAAGMIGPGGRAVVAGATLRPDFRARPSEIPVVSAAEVLSGKAGDRLDGRIVFVGLSAAGLEDRHIVSVTEPGTTDSGVLIHASICESVLAGGLLRAFPPWAAGPWGALLVLFTAPLRRRGTPFALAGAAIVALSPLLLLPASLAVLKLELPAVSVVTAFFLTAATAELLARRRADARIARATEELETSLHPGDRLRTLESLAEEAAARNRTAAATRSLVAHELKTPLTSMKGLAQLLAGFDLTPAESRRVAGLVAQETTRLAGMVDALLDVERLQVRSFDATTAAVPLSELVEKRVATLDGGRGLLEGSVSEGLVVRGDERLLERVLDNLVGNALKFAPEGTKVRVRLFARGEEAVLEVEDDGPGVPAAEREAIFRPFVRGSGGEKTSGLGLGLALVREVALWHRGFVEVHEGARGGAQFRVILPVVRDRCEARNGRSLTSSGE